MGKLSTSRSAYASLLEIAQNRFLAAAMRNEEPSPHDRFACVVAICMLRVLGNFAPVRVMERPGVYRVYGVKSGAEQN